MNTFCSVLLDGISQSLHCYSLMLRLQCELNNFLWRIFMNHVLNFYKLAWYSDFSKLSDSRVSIPSTPLVQFMYDE